MTAHANPGLPAAFILSVNITLSVCSESALNPSNSLAVYPRLQLRRSISFSSQMDLDVDLDNASFTFPPASAYYPVYSTCFFPLQENKATKDENPDKRWPRAEKRNSQREIFTRLQTQLYPHIEF